MLLPEELKSYIDNGFEIAFHGEVESSYFQQRQKQKDEPFSSFHISRTSCCTKNFNPQFLVGEGGFGKIVAVKQLDRNGLQGNRELFYENRLLDLCPGKEPLDWTARMKIASGAAKGLEYLHYTMILILIFILRAAPLFKDRSQFTAIADPLLGGKYPKKSLYQALAIAAMCIQEEADRRPLIADVVMALEYLAMPIDEKKATMTSTESTHHVESVKGGNAKEELEA
ncbi:hypothetical protein SADUNF_Sadunf11G0000300 [Salix dunnii]|uniref:Protein kinase domain-containing protein n=1 Tax=Salix dunnii TaxID=1413687 RepID=A0A835MSP2_9ROSI|nr:hypothetical protein SADUNF_Sadunf11G0000300 [Salix dunnii]